MYAGDEEEIGIDVHDMNGWNFWGHGMGIGMIFWWVLGIAAIVLVVTMLTKQGGKSTNESEAPLEIVKRRYAKGEISKEEFEKLNKDLA